MKFETLQQANELKQKISSANKELEKIKIFKLNSLYNCYLTGTGYGDSILVPESLKQTFIEGLITFYELEISMLKAEFEKL